MKEVTPEEWRAELLSGRWRRAAGQLRKGSNYACCLGVLAEMTGAPVCNPEGQSFALLQEKDVPAWLNSWQGALSSVNDIGEKGQYWAEDGPVIAFIDILINQQAKENQ